MQFLSGGQRPIREEAAARDARLEAGDRAIPIDGALLDGVHDDANALMLLKPQFRRGNENPMRTDGLSDLSHG